jgi:hypothetical protein
MNDLTHHKALDSSEKKAVKKSAHIAINEFNAKKINININSSSSVFNSLQRTDEAMLNSILSFAVYDRNSWMIENLNSNLSDMPEIVNDLMQDKEKIYNLKVWYFMKNTFEKIPDNELKIPSEGVYLNNYHYETNFKFKDGQYSAANGLAHASVLRSKNPLGGNILHLSFRGTEFSRLTEYLKGPYLDMSAYYEHFKPLVAYLRKYVKNSKNNISEIQVNGHSLGGAMVQEFLKDNSFDDFEVPIKGFTFGSPGSEKNKFYKFATLAYHSLGRGINILINPNSIPTNNDGRITQFYHKNDPVPRVGLLGYQKGGGLYNLADITYEESKQAKLEPIGILRKLPLFGKLIGYFKETLLDKLDTKFHDSARYIMNLRNEIDKYYEIYDQFPNILLENTKNYQHWMINEIDFTNLAHRNKDQLISLLKKSEPNLNDKELKNKITDIRKRMMSDTHAEIILKKTPAARNNLQNIASVLTAENHVEFKLDSKIKANRIKNGSIPKDFHAELALMSEEYLVNNSNSHNTALEKIKKIQKKLNEEIAVKESLVNKI